MAFEVGAAAGDPKGELPLPNPRPVLGVVDPKGLIPEFPTAGAEPNMLLDEEVLPPNKPDEPAVGVAVEKAPC